MATALLVSSCGDSPAGPSGGTGTLNLRLTDSPFSDAKAVLVTFSEVTAHRAESGWTPVPFAAGAGTTWTCDLKKLEDGAEDVLGSGLLEAGQYTQVRLVVKAATIYFDGEPVVGGPACAAAIAPPAGSTIAKTASVEIPSGEVKLNRGFEVLAGGVTKMVLDFDGDRSIHMTGNGRHMMSPVVAIVRVE